MFIKQGTSLWYLRDQCWRGLQQMFHCTRCCWMSAPCGCSSRQESQRERAEQWSFWDLFLCSRSGRHAYHQMGDGAIAPRKSQWSKYSQNPCPASRLAGGTSCCDNQCWGDYHDSAMSEEFIPWIESWSNHYWHCSHHERMWVDFVAQMWLLSSWPAMFVCPACSLLCGFRAKCFKVRGCLLCQEVAVHLFNRENSAFYPPSMAMISHTISHSMYLNPWAVSILASHQSAIADHTFQQ